MLKEFFLKIYIFSLFDKQCEIRIRINIKSGSGSASNRSESVALNLTNNKNFVT